MLLQEFEKKTGYFPTFDEYKMIEQAYMCFKGDKDAFCRAYKENKDGLAVKIQHEANMRRIKAQKESEKTIEEYKAQIAKLEKFLELEQEWKSYEDKDNVLQTEYKNLANCFGTKEMTDDAAKELIYNWFGFAKEQIKILRFVPVYEINRHRQLRKIGEIERPPLYHATDWNYIRFDCCCMCYELQDGMLRLYK